MRLIEVTTTRPHIAWRGGYPFVLAANIDHLDARAMEWCEQWRARADDDPVPIDLDAIDAELDAEEAGEPIPDDPLAEASPKTPADPREIVLAAIREAGTIRARALAEKLPLSETSRGRALRALVRDGLIVAEGKTKGKTYRMPELAPPKPLTRVAPQANGNGKAKETVEGRVLVAVLYRKGTTAELAERLELETDVVAEALRKLEGEGEVKMWPGGVWCRG
jgi:DNA-binding MarR family transcriptional regulator